MEQFSGHESEFMPIMMAAVCRSGGTVRPPASMAGSNGQRWMVSSAEKVGLSVLMSLKKRENHLSYVSRNRIM